MVAQLIDFFEWSLDGKFTDAQRQQFQRDRIAEWQNHQQTEIEANLKLLAVYGQLAALTADQRNALKPNIQAELLKAIHAQPNNSTAQILLTVYEANHRSNINNSIAETHTPNAPTIARELLGEWSSSSSSSIGYVNPNTGSYAAPSGEWNRYKFFPDGSFIDAGMLQSSAYNCTSQVFGYRKGVYRVEGSKIYFEEREYTLTSKDNCHQEWNYEKHPPVSKYVLVYHFERDQYGIKMVMDSPDGKQYIYRPVEGKGIL
jgi:hypothetical protein